MAVRWVVGRAGVGKTSRCLGEMRALMEKEPLGGALILLVPDQATFTVERQLLGAGSHGTFRAQVLSFRRLGMLIGREVGVLTEMAAAGGGRALPKAMDEVARLVLLEEVVREEREKLGVFRAVADRPGFVGKLSGALRELMKHGHSGASLRGVAEGEGVDAVMRGKLLDLAVLMDGWMGVAEKAGAVEVERVMHGAALKMGESSLIVGDGKRGGRGRARVWVDGFSGLSGVEMRMLAGLGVHAEEMTITLLADGDAESFRQMRGEMGREAWGVFSRAERFHRRVTDMFKAHGVKVRGTEVLREPHRFKEEVLKKVEREMFEDVPMRRNAEGARRGRVPSMPSGARAPQGMAPVVQRSLFEETNSPQKVAGVEIWQCSDPETEVRAAAQKIRALVLEGGLRYRQIGVVAPDLEGYGDALRRVLTAHGIPHFVDQRQTIAHHPLVELLRSAVAVKRGRWNQDDVLLLLKTRLAGVSEEEMAWVENYVMEHGINHVPWEMEWRWLAPNVSEEDVRKGRGYVPVNAAEQLARVNAVRKKVWGALKEWTEGSGDKQDGAAWVKGVRGVMTRLKVAEQVGEWVKAEANAGMAQVHEQAVREVEGVLAMLESVLAGKERTLEEFERLLETALEGLTLGLIPPTVDQVVVSSVTRSRVGELEAVIVLGAVEGQFPKVVEEDAILSDAQREQFNRLAEEPIGEGSDRQLLEMPYFDYMALTRAARLLVVSYPVADRKGRAVGRSRYVERLRDLLGDEIKEVALVAEDRRAVDRIGTVEDVLAGVAAWARGVAKEDGVVEEGGVFAGLYDWVVKGEVEAVRAGWELVKRSIQEQGMPVLSRELAERFYPPEKALRLSVSQLEKYASCPLQYFVHYTLGLRPREEVGLDALNVGVLYHRILERVYGKVIEGELKWPDCAEKDLRSVLEKEVDGAIEELHGELAERTPGYEKMRARVKRTLGLVLEADRRRACVGALRPEMVEVAFGGKDVAKEKGRVVGLPVLKVGTKEGHAVELNGKIDRVDGRKKGEVAVIDYKSSAQRKLELHRVLVGLTLQLPVYAVAMERLQGREAVGALYMPLGVKRKSVEDEKEAKEPTTEEFFQQFKERGVIDQAKQHLFETFGEKPKATWYSFNDTKEGRPGAHSDTLTHEDFRLLLEFAEWKVGDLADLLMGGQIAPVPYRLGTECACDQCEFASLCPFDRVSGTYGEVKGMKKHEVLEAMRGMMGTGIHADGRE